MRLLRILGLAALLGLVGCFESDLSVGTVSEQGFVLSDRARFDSKIVLRAAPGKYGPMFLETYGLVGADSTGTTYQFGGLFPYGLINPSTSWIDSELWVDYLVGSPTLVFWDLRSLFHATEYGAENWLDLDLCEDLPKSVFETAKANGQNPVEHHPLLRVGRFIFATAQNPGFGHMSVSRSGLALVRMGDLSSQVGGCSRFEEADAALAAKWIDLPPYNFNPGDASQIMGRITSVVESDFGIYVSYWLQGAPETPNMYRYYLASIDTAGTPRILDSSTTTYYTDLFRSGSRAIAINDRSDLFELTSSDAHPTPLPYKWSPTTYPACRAIEARCVLTASDRLYVMDSMTFEVRALDATGLEGNQITGVVQYKDTVYVSTLSGVFTKPVARFFDPAK